MKRTTIFVEEDVLRRLREIAQRDNTTVSDAIRSALKYYVSRRKRRRPPVSLVGVGRSGRHDVAERAEELLEKGFGY